MRAVYVRDRARGGSIRHGLSLVEILVILGIIALTLAILLPAVQQVRDAAARARCASNLRQLAVAVHLYSQDNHHLPRGCDYPFLSSDADLKRHAGLSWHTSILPYLEQAALWTLAWEAHKEDPSSNADVHLAVRAKTILVFMCPSDPRQTGGYGHNGIVWGLTSYPGVAGTHHRREDGVFHKDFTVRFADITDGTSNTLAIGERPPGPQGRFGAWYSAWGSSICPLAQILGTRDDETASGEGEGDCPLDTGPLRPGQLGSLCHVSHFWSLHRGGASFGFADGSVRFLRYSHSAILSALATRAGGESIFVPD